MWSRPTSRPSDLAACRLRVRVTPRGGADRIDGVETDPDGRPLVRVRVRAVPAEGEANEAVILLLSRALGLPKSTLEIVSGAGSRIKTVEIDGLDETAALNRLLT